jgi:MoxR-like ATPase
MGAAVAAEAPAGGEVAAPVASAPAGLAPPGVPASGEAAPVASAPAAVPGSSAPAGAARSFFLDVAAIRAAGDAAGLVLPEGVYANVAAALDAGRHVLLTGAPGCGKTTLALAVARAAARAGRAGGAALLPAADPDLRERVVEAARRGRWAVVEELERAGAEAALGALSTFLGGLPLTLPPGDEVAPAADWRVVATWGGSHPRGAVLRRFAVVEVAAPPPDDLRRALHAAAGGDPAALAAAERLQSVGQIAPLGAGVLLDAARHAAARNAAAPADAATLAREAFAAYVAPLLRDGDAAARARELVESWGAR